MYSTIADIMFTVQQPEPQLWHIRGPSTFLHVDPERSEWLGSWQRLQQPKQMELDGGMQYEQFHHLWNSWRKRQQNVWSTNQRTRLDEHYREKYSDVPLSDNSVCYHRHKSWLRLCIRKCRHQTGKWIIFLATIPYTKSVLNEIIYSKIN